MPCLSSTQVGGVDMVLSSLTSPGMVAATASVLRLGGCFIELGKRYACRWFTTASHRLNVLATGQLQRGRGS